MNEIMHIKDCEISSIGLTIAQNISFEAWEKIGRSLAQINGSVGWWVADWIIYGEQKWGEKYKEALERTHFDEQTLRNYVWVANKIELSRRRDTLGISLHQEVASLAPEVQDVLLEQAETNGWGQRQLRSHVARIKSIPPVAEVPLAEENMTQFPYVPSGNKSFFEQLEGMPPKQFCIVCLIVKGFGYKDMLQVLRTNHEELNTMLHQQKLNDWHVLRAILDL